MLIYMYFLMTFPYLANAYLLRNTLYRRSLDSIVYAGSYSGRVGYICTSSGHGIHVRCLESTLRSLQTALLYKPNGKAGDDDDFNNGEDRDNNDDNNDADNEEEEEEEEEEEDYRRMMIVEEEDDDEMDDDEIENPVVKFIFETQDNTAKQMMRNPVARIFINTYNLFYGLPKRNMPYDIPWQLFKNSSTEWISWYQIPHNLPPYGYVGEGYRKDMFCYGLEGSTLPLGNWDPAGFQLVSKKVLRKYRESELKHGRLSMLASLGMLTQELFHPLYPNVGGMAITHLAQIRELQMNDNKIYAFIMSIVTSLGVQETTASSNVWWIPSDYIVIVLALASFEAFALVRNWDRWLPNEYNHQFDHNIGIGNLKEGYQNGDYGFDPFNLFPSGRRERKRMVECELNHGRLAMISVIGMIAQEYLTDQAITSPFLNLVSNSPMYIEGIQLPLTSFDFGVTLQMLFQKLN